MRIIISLSIDEHISALGSEVHRAVEVLRVAHIQTEGSMESGRDRSGSIILRQRADITRAIVVLGNAGIQASTA